MRSGLKKTVTVITLGSILRRRISRNFCFQRILKNQGMETRSSGLRRSESEYQELKLLLCKENMFEDGMELQEMREICKVLKDSIASPDQELQQALIESEKEFSSIMVGAVHNSTMLSAPSESGRKFHQGYNSDSDDNDIPHFEIITTVTQVHHELNWSPTRGNESGNRQARKRPSEGSLNGSENDEIPAKRANVIPASHNENDSGVNLSEITVESFEDLTSTLESERDSMVSDSEISAPLNVYDNDDNFDSRRYNNETDHEYHQSSIEDISL